MSTSERDTDRDWNGVAEEDPFLGVLSKDEFRKEVMTADELKHFMASGEKFVDDIFGCVRKYLFSDFAPIRGLDVGCGVGRLAIPLAKKVKEAVGVDIAPAMFQLCAMHAKLAGVDNLVLFESDD